MDQQCASVAFEYGLWRFSQDRRGTEMLQFCASASSGSNPEESVGSKSRGVSRRIRNGLVLLRLGRCDDRTLKIGENLVACGRRV